MSMKKSNSEVRNNIPSKASQKEWNEVANVRVRRLSKNNRSLRTISQSDIGNGTRAAKLSSGQERCCTVKRARGRRNNSQNSRQEGANSNERRTGSKGIVWRVISSISAQKFSAQGKARQLIQDEKWKAVPSNEDRREQRVWNMTVLGRRGLVPGSLML